MKTHLELVEILLDFRAELANFVDDVEDDEEGGSEKNASADEGAENAIVSDSTHLKVDLNE